MSKKIILILIIIIIALGALIYARKSDTPSLPANASLPPEKPALSQGQTNPKTGVIRVVKMTEDAFDPKEIIVKRGDTIRWVNEDDDFRWPASNIHPTHGIYPEFDPREPIASGNSWSFTFEKAGTWKFHDHLIPRLKGTIEVTE